MLLAFASLNLERNYLTSGTKLTACMNYKSILTLRVINKVKRSDQEESVKIKPTNERVEEEKEKERPYLRIS